MMRCAAVHEFNSRRVRLAAIGLCAAAAIAACGGQDQAAGASFRAAPATQLNAPATDAAVLGFEDPALWSATSGALESTAVRTQGAAAVAITNPANNLDLLSSKVSSSAAALSGALDPGATFAVDVLVPAVLGNARNAGSLQLFASCPSRGVKQAELGSVAFTGTRLGIFRTARFAVGDRLRAALTAGACDDLTFDLRLHAPGRVAGQYVFDNFRVHSPSVAPPSPGSSVDLTAKLAYAPALSTPGSATFPVGIIQVPLSLHVKLGNAGGGSALLELGFGASAFMSCTYGAATGGTSYAFASCTNGAQPGDLVPADFARLTLSSGDPGAGVTKVLAQLPLNPVGDTAGAGVIPPMPTWWGDTPDEANQIITAWFQQVNAAPKLEERWIEAPTPDFALRHGDGTPYDTTIGPPPPNDPPFHQSGHLNPGSSTWDAWWQLDGSLSGSTNNVAETTTHFDATFGAYALVWGDRIEIAKAVAAFDSGPTTAGSLYLYLFTVQLPVGGSVDPSLPISLGVSYDHTFDLPAIHIWIFSITVGVNAGVSLDATGTLSPAFMNFALTPGGHVGAHLEGDIDIYVASGGVSATVDLIRVTVPITANASWGISTQPDDCVARFAFDMGGKVNFSSGGGEVDLVAKFGVCPICDHESVTIFSWGPLASKTFDIFNFAPSTITTPLDRALCFLPLTVSIGSPIDGLVAQSGLPVLAGAVAIRPATGGNPAFNLPCNTITWTTSPATLISDGGVGCSPFITFGGTGHYTVTATATDSFGESGSATVGVRVLPALAGFHAFISPGPPPGFTYVPVLPTEATTFTGSVTGGTPPFFYNWAVLDLSNTEVAGQSGSATSATQDRFVLQPIDPADLHINFHVEDSSQPTSQVATATVAIGPLVR